MSRVQVPSFALLVSPYNVRTFLFWSPLKKSKKLQNHDFQVVFLAFIKLNRSYFCDMNMKSMDSLSHLKDTLKACRNRCLSTLLKNLYLFWYPFLSWSHFSGCDLKKINLRSFGRSWSDKIHQYQTQRHVEGEESSLWKLCNEGPFFYKSNPISKEVMKSPLIILTVSGASCSINLWWNP